MQSSIYHTLFFRLLMFTLSIIGGTWFGMQQLWIEFTVCLLFFLYSLWKIIEREKRNAQKVAFMFDAIDNDDLSFQFATRTCSSNDQLIHSSMNRIMQILFKAKADAAQKEKYYELILNCVNTGIIVLDDNGVVFQTNQEAMRLLGLQIFTHVKQLSRIDDLLETTFLQLQPGDKQQISFNNERGNVHLSIRVSDMILHEKHVRIIVLNDINSELDDKEIDSWIRLTRVLTHEIMNSVTPITSLSDTLLSLHQQANDEIRNGLEVISTTGKSLIAFVESYRRFTHIPTPEPSLFFVQKFLERMVKLSYHPTEYPHVVLTVQVEPEELILHADEKLISQVVLNLLKNALQAIGPQQTDGRIRIKAYCNQQEAVLIDVINNGPAIPAEEADHIFIPFFTTKEGGSGIGLSISRQIMRLSGGTITLINDPKTKETIFRLTFP